MFEPHPYHRIEGCRTTRLERKKERKKGDLGLSIKGGSEHGIAIVVSSIDKASLAGRYNVHTHLLCRIVFVTVSHIHLGDEILYQRDGLEKWIIRLADLTLKSTCVRQYRDIIEDRVVSFHVVKP